MRDGQTVERHSQVPPGLDGQGLSRDWRPRSRSQCRTGNEEAQSARPVDTPEAGLPGARPNATPPAPTPRRSTPPEVSPGRVGHFGAEIPIAPSIIRPSALVQSPRSHRGNRPGLTIPKGCHPPECLGTPVRLPLDEESCLESFVKNRRHRCQETLIGRLGNAWESASAPLRQLFHPPLGAVQRIQARAVRLE